MATDPRSNPVPGDPAWGVSAWRRVLAWVVAFEEAADTSVDEVQDRRILALERDVADLKAGDRGSSARGEHKA